ncbi:MerC family mercury resistance protein, partial [Myxococcus llanfairpwllgwyngyllgogerychwyrndrobwllllantysiliogogogochensis]
MGQLLSALCVVHCVVLPAVLGLVPAAGSTTQWTTH